MIFVLQDVGFSTYCMSGEYPVSFRYRAELPLVDKQIMGGGGGGNC